MADPRVIKVTFAIIYIIVVTLLLFLSTSIAITFASRLTKPIINLIGASDSISKGALDVKVPELETDEEFKDLNRNFNSMIQRLKEQQDKLLLNERYEAWITNYDNGKLLKINVDDMDFVENKSDYENILSLIKKEL